MRDRERSPVVPTLAATAHPVNEARSPATTVQTSAATAELTTTTAVPSATIPSVTVTIASPTPAVLTPTATITSSANRPVTPTVRPTPPLRPIPGDPRPYLETYRLVTFYGSPPSPALGILGAAPRETITERLRGVAALYQDLSPDRYVLPTFHLIVTIADPIPGRSGNFNHYMDDDLLDDWITAADAEGVAVILDVQPGYGDVLAEVERLRPYLYRPHVHLALDSEFTMDGGAIPGRSLGRLFPHHINPVQAMLDEIALEIGVNKVLIIHQFDDVMVIDKEGIVDYPHVEMVFDADGFGNPEGKRNDYLQYAGEPGFEYGGFKLFYDWDWPLMAPADVMSLEPRPAVIVYQ